MFEADPLTTAQFATNAAQTVLQAGPPSELPAQVPEFVLDILSEISAFVGGESGGIGETVSGLTPGGSEAAGRQG
jgi:hypothetical protein